jgi:citrate synthase
MVMTDTETATHASLHVGARDASLQIVPSAQGEPGLNVGALLKETGNVTLDGGFTNTASCTSAITYIDGDAGILRYRGYPIEQLAKQSSFIETSYLLIYGELPTPSQLAEFEGRISQHTMLHEDLKGFFQGFPRDAHPMPVLSSAVSALSTFYQDSLDPFDKEQVEISTIRLLAKLPTIAAYAYKKSIGQPFLYPDNNLSLVENFLRMTFGVPATDYEIDPDLVRAVDLLLVLHADHEQNCSTSTVRLVGSSQANLFASVSAGINALFGPLHGGANQAVLEMLERIEKADFSTDEFMTKVKNKEDGVRLMGFGHRVYKNYDPRAAIIKDRPLHEILAKTAGDHAARDRHAPRGDRPGRRVLHRAQALPERRLLHGPDLQGDGLPDAMFTVLFALGPPARLDRPVARDDRGPDDQDRAAAPGLHRCHRAGLRRDRLPLTTPGPRPAHQAGRVQSAVTRVMVTVS